MYGTEYDSIVAGLFSHNINMVGHDVPCAVCRSTERVTSMMIPGRHVCYSGWHQEYSGYLMAGYHGHKSGTEYVCVDDDPEMEQGDSRDDNGALLDTVEGICGSLPCPPYVNGREITCTVCTK